LLSYKIVGKVLIAPRYRSGSLVGDLNEWGLKGAAREGSSLAAALPGKLPKLNNDLLFNTASLSIAEDKRK